MKKLILLFTVFFIFSCNNEIKTEEKETEPTEEIYKTKNFDWLIGKWQRTDDEKDAKMTFENWRKIDSVTHSGFSFTLQKNDTIWQEDIRLEKKSKNWSLIIQSPEETEATIFRITKFTDTSFTCENKEIDFPNKIEYWKNGEKLNAKVSGVDMEIAFQFEKK